MKPFRIVNVPDVSPGDAFVDLPSIDGRPVEWIGHSGLPANALERAIRRPRLSRYRAAWHAAGDARRADMTISHLPLMTAAVEDAARLRGRHAPHLAFSFNFTDLPTGSRLARMRRALAPVERFGVYSPHEATLYPDLFGIPTDRFHPMMWGQSAPATDLSAPISDRPFVVAIGGEGRDGAGIVAAARARPDLEWIVITRPNPVFEAAPANLHVRYNVPAPLTWGIAARAAAVVVPLKAETTCCGHITLASAQLLGLPLITTRSHATHEYVDDTPGTTVIEPGDADALAVAAAAAIADPAPRPRASRWPRATTAAPGHRPSPTLRGISSTEPKKALSYNEPIRLAARPMKNRTPPPRDQRPALPAFDPIPRQCKPRRLDLGPPARLHRGARRHRLGRDRRADGQHVERERVHAPPLRRHPQATGFAAAWEAATSMAPPFRRRHL